MKSIPLFTCLSVACVAAATHAQEPDPPHLSPDGRFRFEAFSVEDNDAGKRPAFGIIETATGDLVSDPEEELGDAFRPSESIFWSPDSLSYALTSRVGTRHIDTFFYRWNGKSFVRAKWEVDAQLENWADEEVGKELTALKLPADSGLGQCLRGDDLVERWLDPSRLIVNCVLEYTVGGEDSETVVDGSSRAIVRWDEAADAYAIERRLPVSEPWPARLESIDFAVTQEDDPAQEGRCTITVTDPDSGEKRTFTAENHLTEPIFLHTDDEWPALELVNHGPEGFEWRRIYRHIDGAYRCTRIVELTHLFEQAPEGAALFEIDPNFFALVLRDRNLKAGDLETYESFQTEVTAPGGKWKAVFTYHPQYLQRVEIVAADGSGEPSVIYDFDEGSYGLQAIAKPFWSTDGSALALYLQDAPRVGSTLLYRELNRVGNDRVWSGAEMPEIDYSFIEKATAGKNAHWGQQLESPLYWKNPRELVLSLTGHFRGEEGFDYAGVATLSWDESGNPAGCVTVETSPQ